MNIKWDGQDADPKILRNGQDTYSTEKRE